MAEKTYILTESEIAGIRNRAIDSAIALVNDWIMRECDKRCLSCADALIRDLQKIKEQK